MVIKAYTLPSHGTRDLELRRLVYKGRPQTGRKRDSQLPRLISLFSPLKNSGTKKLERLFLTLSGA